MTRTTIMLTAVAVLALEGCEPKPAGGRAPSGNGSEAIVAGAKGGEAKGGSHGGVGATGPTSAMPAAAAAPVAATPGA